MFWGVSPPPQIFALGCTEDITLFAENLGILPIDDVIVLHCMVSNSEVRHHSRGKKSFARS